MKNSKHDQIKKHLLAGYAITGMQAFNLFNVYRLSSVINRLRIKDKMNINTEMVKDSNGRDAYAKYKIIHENQN